MLDCVRCTGITTLLIGLQLFSVKIVNETVELPVLNNVSVNELFSTAPIKNSQDFEQIDQSIIRFEPLDNGGPHASRGSGTR